MEEKNINKTVHNLSEEAPELFMTMCALSLKSTRKDLSPEEKQDLCRTAWTELRSKLSQKSE